MLPIVASANLSQMVVRTDAGLQTKKWPRKPGPFIQIVDGKVV